MIGNLFHIWICNDLFNYPAMMDIVVSILNLHIYIYISWCKHLCCMLISSVDFWRPNWESHLKFWTIISHLFLPIRKKVRSVYNLASMWEHILSYTRTDAGHNHLEAFVNLMLKLLPHLHLKFPSSEVKLSTVLLCVHCLSLPVSASSSVALWGGFCVFVDASLLWWICFL